MRPGNNVMQIMLLRHGVASDSAPSGRDSDRALTAEGVKRLKLVLEQARRAGVAPSLIITSPYRRARETAELAAKVLGYGQEIVQTAALEPGGRPEQVWDEIRAFRGEDQILLAGHEPLFSALSAYLLNAPTLAVDFKKGALVRVDMPSLGAAPRGILRWMLTPRLVMEEAR
jgi:phosphohistidine phosphatase